MVGDRNPWLDTPTSDYEAHMGLDSVRQRQALSQLFAEMARWHPPGGVLSVVLQLPSAASAPVSRTPYPSLELLAPLMRLVPPELLDRLARACRLEPLGAREVQLPRGKKYWRILFRRATTAVPRV